MSLVVTGHGICRKPLSEGFGVSSLQIFLCASNMANEEPVKNLSPMVTSHLESDRNQILTFTVGCVRTPKYRLCYGGLARAAGVTEKLDCIFLLR